MRARPTVVVTGITGNLGRRLLPLLHAYSVVGTDVVEPGPGVRLDRFERLDLAHESSCSSLMELLSDTRAEMLVHLAFLNHHPVGAGEAQQIWQANVVGTARVMEAIAAVNRAGVGPVRKFVFHSSASAYGPALPHPVDEDYPLGAHTLLPAIHHQEADDVVRVRARQLGACSTYVLRAQLLTGIPHENYLVDALRGAVSGEGMLANWLRRRGTRLPLLLPRGDQYLVKRCQFLAAADLARLIACILRWPESGREPVVLNVAGAGDSISIHLAARIARQKIVQLPTALACRWAYALLWNLGVSAVPPQALPYIVGNCLVDTARIRAFLGSKYFDVIRTTSEDALQETVSAPAGQRRSVTASASA